jgi:hypothetical protein
MTTPQLVVSKLSRLDIAHDRGIIHVLVDGELKLAMPSEQAIEFCHMLERCAYEAQQALNIDQARYGDPTVYCKTGTVSLKRAFLQRLFSDTQEEFKKE